MSNELFANYARTKPGSAARMVTHFLESDDRAEHERGVAMAAALRESDRCAVCGARLRNPESRRLNIGPECRKKRGQAARALAALRSAGFGSVDSDALLADLEEDNA